MAELTRKHLLAAMRAGKHIDGLNFTEASRLLWRNSEKDWLQPFKAPFQRSSIEYPDELPNEHPLAKFEEAANDARDRLTSIDAKDKAKRVTLKRSELEAALAEAVADLAQVTPGATPPTSLMNMRRGLQLFGVHVVKDDDKDDLPLQLANARLPFSLRLIACSFEMPISLSSASVVTLDLSGSAVPGIDATFLDLGGSLRLRRLYSSAPLDFTGARIHGFLDGADMVLQPFGEHPPAQAVSPERAMLGLNQVQIDNEIRLQRAQIWGGITMRGLEAKRSIYMSDAVVLAPLAVLEAMAKAAQVDDPNGAADDEDYRLPGDGASTRGRKEPQKWREETWQRGWKSEFKKALESFEYAHDESKPALSKAWQDMALHSLLTSNLRARTSAIRTDGMKIAGSVFMQRMVCHGRLRAKYSEIEGSLTLAGARLRSTEALMPTFDKIALDATQADEHKPKRLHAYRKRTYEDLIDPEDHNTGKLARGSDTFALDLRECRIEGDIRIGIEDTKLAEAAAWSTCIDGDSTLDQARLGGKLLLNGVIFEWSQRVPEADQSPPPEEGYKSFIENQRTMRATELKKNKKHHFSARGLTTADNVDFCGCSKLKGADFSNATIGGDLRFFNDWQHPEDAEKIRKRGTLKVEEPALALDGATIHLAGASVSGDLNLIFDPMKDKGPWIHAERATVGGLLSIMPPGDANGEVIVTAEAYRKTVNRIRDEIGDFRQWAAESRSTFGTEMQKWKETRPVLDLANVRTMLFEFPPPAWPHAARMIIAGFHYERGRLQGPLGPHPLADENLLPNSVKKRSLFWTVCAFAFLVSGAALLYFALSAPKMYFSGSSPIFLALLMVISAMYIGIPLLTSPRSLHIAPMANTWLELQDPVINAYRTKPALTSWPAAVLKKLMMWAYSVKLKPKGNLFRSLEPYTIAADALRREGRWISANLVEQERFRVRNWQLSWRTHFLQKLSFKFSDWLTEYGYNYARLMFFSALAVILAAMTVERAQRCGAIGPKVQNVNLLPPLAARPGEGGIECRDFPTEEDRIAITRNLDVAMFALDTVLPIMDLGEAATWEVNKETTALGVGWWGPAREFVTYARLLAFFHTVGLALAGLLLLGLSTRFGHWLARYGD